MKYMFHSITCAVVDVHQDWCGICEAIHPTFSRILLEYENAEGRMIFAAANVGKIGTTIQASLPSDSHINLEKNGCLPLFALYRFKSCVSVIVGVDGPLLLQQIAMNVPEKAAAED